MTAAAAIAICALLAVAALSDRPLVLLLAGAGGFLATVGALAGLARVGLGGLAVRLVLAVEAAAAMGTATSLAVAGLSAHPLVFLLAGAGTFVVATLAFVGLATRRLEASRRPRTRMLASAVGVLAGASCFALTALVPLGDPRLDPAPVAGQHFWQLSTGSRIAYVRIPARGREHATPLVFLHGGPAVADMRGEAAFFGRLARDGFDVYVYDEVGSGFSSRLPDPRDYSLQRDIDDLEAVRKGIKARRLVLIGHSYGAEIAAGYLAEHPQHVSGAVFSSPGPLDPNDGSEANITNRLSAGQRLRAYALTASPAPCSRTDWYRSTREPPARSRATRRWTPASTGSTTGRAQRSTVADCPRGPRFTVSACTHSLVPSLPARRRNPTSARRSRASTPRR